MNLIKKVPGTTCPHDNLGRRFARGKNISEKGDLLGIRCLDCKEEIPKPPGGPTLICDKCWGPMGPLMGRILPDHRRIQYSNCTVCGVEYSIPVPQSEKKIIKIK